MQTKKIIWFFSITILILTGCQQTKPQAQSLLAPTNTSIPPVATQTPTPPPIIQCNIPLDPNLELQFQEDDSIINAYTNFLNQGGDWEKLLVFSAHRIQPLDVNNDQELDFLFESQNTTSLICCTSDGYQRYLLTPENTTLLTYGDFNQNKSIEFILLSPFCDINFCYNDLKIIEWRYGKFENIFMNDISDMVFSSAKFEKIEQQYQLIVRSNRIETTNSGAVRDEERRFVAQASSAKWNLLSSAQDFSPYRLHHLLDGEQAYYAGDFALAKAFFVSVAYDTNLIDWRVEEFPEQAEAVIALAQMRLVEFYLREGDPQAAQDLFEWMDEIYDYGTPAFRLRGIARVWVLEYELRGIEKTVKDVEGYIYYYYEDFENIFVEEYYGSLNELPFRILFNSNE